MKACIIHVFCIFYLLACQLQVIEIKESPLIPMEMFAQQGDKLLLRAPIHTYDRNYNSIGYTSEGEVIVIKMETTLFPTDVYVVYLDGMEVPQVFLARAPKSGCILKVDIQEDIFSDPCSGSKFELDGTYIFGPAEQDLDIVPSEVKGEMLWIRNEIIYGTLKIAEPNN